MRIIASIMSTIISSPTSAYYSTRPCYVVDYMYSHNQTAVELRYPACAAYYSGNNTEQYVPTHANMLIGPEGAAASFNVSFGAAGWLALFLHIVGAEIYLHLTPREAERLRRVSYQRQLEAGYKNPGNAGLTVQVVGDAEAWTPPQAQPVEGGRMSNHSSFCSEKEGHE